MIQLKCFQLNKLLIMSSNQHKQAKIGQPNNDTSPYKVSGYTLPNLTLSYPTKIEVL